MTHIPLIICIALCAAFGLTILLSACKAAGRNPLEFSAVVPPSHSEGDSGIDKSSTTTSHCGSFRLATTEAKRTPRPGRNSSRLGLLLIVGKTLS